MGRDFTGRERNSGPGRRNRDDMSRQRQRDSNKRQYEDEEEYEEEYELDEEEYLSPPPPRRRAPQQEPPRYPQPPRRPTRRVSPASSPYRAVPRRTTPSSRLPEERPSAQQPPRPPQRPRPPQPPVRQRSRWPTLLMGCMLGVMGAVVAAVIFFLYVLHSLQGGNGPGIIPGVGEKTFTRSDPPITVPITSVTQVFVCNKSGNVSLSVDPNASAAKIAVSRKVQAQSEADAEKEYQNIKVQAQTMGTLDIQGACKSPLAVPSGAATAPASTNTATPTSTTTGDTTKTSLVVNVAFLNDDELNKAPVDLAISLPQRALPTISATQPINMLVGVEVSRRGDITIGKGISGVFDLNGSLNGNITIDGTMAPNSHISTPEGLITFRGDLAIPTVAPSQGQTYNFILSGTKIDATLPANRDLTLHIVTPGKINSGEFTLQQDGFSKDGTTTNYNGPLNPNAPPPPSDYQVKPADIQLTLRASRGDVILHKKL